MNHRNITNLNIDMNIQNKAPPFQINSSTVLSPAASFKNLQNYDNSVCNKNTDEKIKEENDPIILGSLRSTANQVMSNSTIVNHPNQA